MPSATAIRRLLLVAASTLLLVAPGCAYLESRAQDLADPLDVQLGVGLGATARVTHYAQAGFGFSEEKLRIVGRDWGPTHTYTREIGVSPIAYYRQYLRVTSDAWSDGVYLPAFAPYGNYMGAFLILYFVARMVEPPEGWGTADEVALFRTRRQRTEPYQAGFRDRWRFWPGREAYREKYDRGVFDIGVGAYALLGAEVHLNPFELLDFFLGFFGVDIAGDDPLEVVPPADLPDDRADGNSSDSPDAPIETPTLREKP